MALKQLNSMIQWPGTVLDLSGNPAFVTGTTLDAAGEYLAIVHQAREAMTVSHVGFRTSTCTGSPKLDVRIETVDPATGDPTGTLWAANTNIVTATLVTNTFALHALTASASIAAGEFFALKFAFNTGTSVVIQPFNNTQTLSGSLPFVVTSLGGTVTPANMTTYPIALGSDATTFYALRNLLPITAAVIDTTFNATNGEKKGARFQVPFKCRCVGFRWPYFGAASINAAILDDGGAELSGSSTAIDFDIRDTTTGQGGHELIFGSPVTLSPGTWYRATIEPASGVTNSSFASFTLPSADYRSAWPGGTNFYLAELTSGVWTDSTDKVPHIDLLIDQLDDGNNNSPIWAMAGG